MDPRTAAACNPRRFFVLGLHLLPTRRILPTMDIETYRRGPLPDSIRRLRLKTGLTQKEAAERMTLNKSTIERWENGRTRPDWSDLERLAGVYSCTAEDFYRPVPA